MMKQPEWKEITISEINGYFITAGWGPRVETPEELAKRFFRMIDALKRIDPVFGLWTCGIRDNLETHRDNFAEVIKKKIERDDFGAVIPGSGYWFGARTEGQPPDRLFSVQCHGGKCLGGLFGNNVILRENLMVQAAPEMHNYQTFHATLLAIVDAWDPDSVEANCSWLVQRKKYDFPFRPAWMRYLCPALARQAQPPASAFAEDLPNGGLLLSATQETFDVDNSKHVAAAEEIAVALAKFDLPTKAPWT